MLDVRSRAIPSPARQGPPATPPADCLRIAVPPDERNHVRTLMGSYYHTVFALLVPIAAQLAATPHRCVTLAGVPRTRMVARVLEVLPVQIWDGPSLAFGKGRRVGNGSSVSVAWLRRCDAMALRTAAMRQRAQERCGSAQSYLDCCLAERPWRWARLEVAKAAGLDLDGMSAPARSGLFVSREVASSSAGPAIFRHHRLLLRGNSSKLAALRLALGERGWSTAVVTGGTFASLALVEQVRLFTNASLVVAGHDGALTNLLFCRPFTTVIEITPYVGQAEAPIQHLRAMFQAAAGSMAAAAYEVRHFSVPGAACDWGCASQRAMLRLVESPWPNRNAHKQPKMRKI